MSGSNAVDQYLAALNDDQRDALEKLRKAIRSAAPDAEECISYQIPGFRLGKMLVAYGAARNHCSFYAMSPEVIKRFQDKLTRFETSKGTIRFQPDTPLPVTLVRHIVKARIAENAGSENAGSTKRTAR